MFQEVQDQVQWRADLLIAGRYEDMCREYLFPLPVYLQSRLMALRSPDEGIEHAARLRDALQRRQIKRLTITVRAIDLPRRGRFRVWADWHAVSAVDRQSRRLGLIYFMRATPLGNQSEMLQYQWLSQHGDQTIPAPQQQRA